MLYILFAGAAIGLYFIISNAIVIFGTAYAFQIILLLSIFMAVWFTIKFKSLFIKESNQVGGKVNKTYSSNQKQELRNNFDKKD